MNNFKHKSKITIKIDKNGNIVNKYNSMRECAKNNKIAVTTLHKIIKNNILYNNYTYKFL